MLNDSLHGDGDGVAKGPPDQQQPFGGAMPPDGFHIRPLHSGDVEFAFVHKGKTLAAGSCTPQQAGGLATNFLLAANNAFHISEKTLSDKTGPIEIANPLTVQQWLVGTTKVADQKALIARIGEANIGFMVHDNDLRGIGRHFIESSWKVQSSRPSLELFRFLFRDFGSDLSGWGGIFIARLKASSRLRTISFWSKLSGRSLRVFRTIRITPASLVPLYAPQKRCIYCGALKYSTKPGLEDRKFGAEHIIPEGLGGTLELPEASCQKCEETTGALVEGRVLGRTLKALRVHLNLKKSGSGPHPKTLPLEASVDGVEQTINLPIEDYPIIFLMLDYGPPDVEKPNTEQGPAVRGARVAQLKYDQKELYKKYRINGFSSVAWDNQMLCRMLAKIGHSLAIAELGKSFSPLLTNLIVSGEIAAMNLIGGKPEYVRDRKSDALHEVGLGYQRINRKTYVVSTIRLFARHDGPTYHVVVGESLESPIARLKRVLANKVSRMPAR